MASNWIMGALQRSLSLTQNNNQGRPPAAPGRRLGMDEAIKLTDYRGFEIFVSRRGTFSTPMDTELTTETLGQLQAAMDALAKKIQAAQRTQSQSVNVY